MKKIISILLLITTLNSFSQTAKIVSVRNGFTDLEITAMSGKTIGDTYVSSDTQSIYTVGTDGIPFLDENKEVIYVNSNSSNVAIEPILENSLTGGIYRLDARNSKENGVEVGGTTGKHSYTFTGNKNVVDLGTYNINSTLIAGNNVDLVNGVGSKNITGNTWNSYIYSTESFNPLTEDFAVSWEIESVDGTIREMGGLDDNPTANQPYSSIDYAIYQVNNYFYSRVYEKGRAILIPDYTTFYFNVGDRAGIRCENGYVTYFVDRGGVITDIYTSTKKATVTLYFKAAFNRGNDASGASVLGNVKFATGLKELSYSVTIRGNSSDDLSNEDIEKLKDIGIDSQSSSKYSDIKYTRNNTARFTNGTIPFPIEVLHTFTGQQTQNIINLTY